MGTLPPETVLVLFLPSTLHTPRERGALQKSLLREIGNGLPATDTLPLRNVTLDFFEAIMIIPSDSPTVSQHHLQRQQVSGNYHYYSAIQPFVPFQALVSQLQITNVEIIGAVVIERHFDSICKCSAVQAVSKPLFSALALRTTTQIKLPSPHSNPHLVPFLGTMGGRPTSWFTQELPIMNKTS
jgi:hypothetical protein